MRGRSPHNRPTVRMKEVYGLLLKLGGEGRWKDLKAHLKELGWGPTTLKRTLDQMIKEKAVIKEARLGQKGAEVWYKTMTEGDLLIPTIVWKPTIEIKGPEGPYVRWIANVREKAKQLDGKEKEIFLRDNLHRIIFAGAMLSPVIQLLIALRNAKINNLNEFETLLNFELGFDYSIKQPDISLLKFLLEYHECAMETIDQILREPYKPPTVPSRSVKGLVESRASAIQWIKSYSNTQTNSKE